MIHHNRSFAFPAVLVVAALGASLAGARGADQPQWGHAWTRNMVSAERLLPDSFDPRSGKNVKWSVRIGTETHSTPVVADGRVYLGTNNGEPRDPKHQGDRGVLMCFSETDGSLLWQLVVPKREEDPYHDWPKCGISSPATVEGDRVYTVDNRGVVLCLDAKGMANGNDGPFRDEGAYMTPRGTNVAAEVTRRTEPSSPDRLLTSAATKMEPGPLDADILWALDLTKEAGIWSHDAAHSSVLIRGDYLYLNSGTGVDNTHKKIRTPDAPSLVVVDKRTGKLIARDRLGIAPDIFHCTWSSPSMASVNGREQIFFAAGNGVVYGFEPLAPGKNDGLATLQTIWQFDFDPAAPKQEVHRYSTNRREGPSNIYGMPVFHEGRLYVAGGGDIFWGKNEAWLKCINPAGRGDITTNGLVWSYVLDKHVLSTPAVHDGLVYIADCGRKFHCVDAAKGTALWTHDLKGEVWASPLVADGKVYLGTRSGQFLVFAASREKNVLSTSELGSPISATVTAANGTLYVATQKELFAVQAAGR